MAQPFDLTHQECPRNTLGASRKYARDMVTVVRHGKWVVDGSRAEVTSRYAKAYVQALKKSRGRIFDQVVDLTG